ncbi:MAG TPA: hypothetical protein VII06_07705 [Chloroflexota bacterium]|jgi:hypothetical protein
MEKRPWWERLLDRDNPAGPIIVLVLLVLAIVLVLILGPMLDRLIEGEPPESLAPSQHDRPLASQAGHYAWSVLRSDPG